MSRLKPVLIGAWAVAVAGQTLPGATTLFVGPNTSVTSGHAYGDLEFNNPLSGTESVGGCPVLEWRDGGMTCPPLSFQDWNTAPVCAACTNNQQCPWGYGNEIWLRGGGQHAMTITTVASTAVSVHLHADNNDGIADILVDGLLVASIDVWVGPGSSVTDNIAIIVDSLPNTTHLIEVVDVGPSQQAGAGPGADDIAIMGAAALGCVSLPACSNLVDTELLPLGMVFGSPVGQGPGMPAFSQDGVDVLLETFLLGGPPFFHMARVDPAPAGCLTNQTFMYNNIGTVHIFNGLFTASRRVTRVEFDYADLGGTENIGVNSAGLFIGELAAAPGGIAPGVSFGVTTAPIPGGTCGHVTLDGCVQTLRLGGQELWIDNVCVTTACICEWDGFTGVNVNDLLAFLGEWFPGLSSADVTCDGLTDVVDLLAFLGCWFPANGGPC